MTNSTVSSVRSFVVALGRSKPAIVGRHILSEVVRTDCLTAAGMLTYATLLSLVPLLTVVISMVAALPGAGDWSATMQDFLFDNFVPAARETIEAKLSELTTNTKGLTAAMGIFLVVTSLILMHNIETTVNRIFGVRVGRSMVNRFLVYWSALTLGPIFLGASLALSSYFFSLRIFEQTQVVGPAMGLARSLVPAAISTAGFVFLFTAVPNRRVPLRHALTGAVLTAILFELAKKGFGLYVASFDGYTQLYGAMAAIPIFLIWIYLSWTVILVGAAFTAALGSFRERQRRHWPRRQLFVLAFRIVGHFHRAQRDGGALDDVQLQELEPNAEVEQIQFVIESLREADMVCRDEDGQWVMTRDLTTLTLGDLYRSALYVWPEATDRVPDRMDQGLVDALNEVATAQQVVLQKPLADYLAQAEKEPSEP